MTGPDSSIAAWNTAAERSDPWPYIERLEQRIAELEHRFEEYGLYVEKRLRRLWDHIGDMPGGI